MIRGMGRKPGQKLSPEAVALVAGRFRILGEPLRIELLQALHGGERTVGELVEIVGSTQPNVSKHLRLLQEAGIVGRRQSGNNVYCFISDPTVFELCDAVCDSLQTRFTEVARTLSRRR